jgi:hypothetical protein
MHSHSHTIGKLTHNCARLRIFTIIHTQMHAYKHVCNALANSRKIVHAFGSLQSTMKVKYSSPIFSTCNICVCVSVCWCIFITNFLNLYYLCLREYMLVHIFSQTHLQPCKRKIHQQFSQYVPLCFEYIISIFVLVHCVEGHDVIVCRGA